MSHFEALYGRPCRTLLSWFESDERVIFSPDIVTEAEQKLRQICANILTAQSCQKSYTDKRHCPLEFEVGDHVYLWVSPMKGVHRFGIKGKLAPTLLVCIPSSTSMGRCPIKWSYHQNCREYIMCSTSHNSKDVWNLRLMWSSKTPLHWNPAWPTRPIPSRFLTNKTESRAARLRSFTRYNGMITLKTKPGGNMKTSYDPTTPSSSRQGNYPTPLVFLASTTISGRDFLLRGEGYNTLCYGSPNLSLITIISGLGMHDVTGLIHLESI
jgi:hypothetical protein